jgi:hypothetical protein
MGKNYDPIGMELIGIEKIVTREANDFLNDLFWETLKLSLWSFEFSSRSSMDIYFLPEWVHCNVACRIGSLDFVYPLLKTQNRLE